MIAIILGLLPLAVLVFGLVDVIRTDSWRFKYLDKVAWVFIVILIPIVGTILWLLIGKERDAYAAPTPLIAPADYVVDPINQQDLDAEVEREIAFHENEARIRRLEAELKARREKG